MKSAIVGGLIAGVVAGLVTFILNISGLYELFSVLPDNFPDPMHYVKLSRFLLISLWGIVWGLLYSHFYDYIPKKGIKKGVVYGLILWAFITVYPATVSAVYGYYLYFIPWISIWFVSICIVYGSLIGFLYKKE